MIEVRGLTKRYGRVLAVDALSFDVRRYRELGWPLREVGALLETRAFHPGRVPPGR